MVLRMNTVRGTAACALLLTAALSGCGHDAPAPTPSPHGVAPSTATWGTATPHATPAPVTKTASGTASPAAQPTSVYTTVAVNPTQPAAALPPNATVPGLPADTLTAAGCIEAATMDQMQAVVPADAIAWSYCRTADGSELVLLNFPTAKTAAAFARTASTMDGYNFAGQKATVKNTWVVDYQPTAQKAADTALAALS